MRISKPSFSPIESLGHARRELRAHSPDKSFISLLEEKSNILTSDADGKGALVEKDPLHSPEVLPVCPAQPSP